MKNPSEGDVLRDEGMAAVTPPKIWVAQYAYLCVNYLRKNRFVTGEELREHCLAHGLPAPRHPNAWGAVFNGLVKEGWLTQTNEWIKPKDKHSHSRQIRFWRSQIFVGPTADKVEVYELPSGADVGQRKQKDRPDSGKHN